MKKREKGQSGVITIILMILIVLVAIVILWNVVIFTLKNSSEEVSINQFAFKGEIKYSLDKKINPNDWINVSINRGSGGGNITGFKLVFEFLDGSSRVYENRISYPIEFETKVYSINGINLKPILSPSNFSKLKKISLYYIFNENRKERHTIELDNAEGPSSGSFYTSSCSYSSWINQRCGIVDGINNCLLNQMYQNRSIISGTGCTDISQCVSNDTCTLISSAVSYWAMDNLNGNIVVDSLGRNNGTLGNAIPETNPTWNSSGKYGGDYHFDGINDFINISDNPSLNLETNPITISAWVNAPNINQIAPILSKRTPSFPFKMYTMGVGLTNSVGAGVANKTFYCFYKNEVPIPTGGQEAYTANLVVDGNWHHVVCKREGGVVEIYLDGVNQSVVRLFNTTDAVNVSSNASLYIGYNNGVSYFNGSIDEVFIFNRSLSQAEITKLYNHDY